MCVEIAADTFLVAIANRATWLDDVSDDDLGRLAEDAARLESTILRVLASNSLSLALRTQQTARLARYHCEVRLRRAQLGKTDLAVKRGGLLGRVAPQLERRRRRAGPTRGAL